MDPDELEFEAETPAAASDNALRMEGAGDAPGADAADACPKARAKGRAAPGEKKSAKKSGRESYKNMKCSICGTNDSYLKNPFCKPCKSDVDAMCKDSHEQGWRDRYLIARKDPDPAIFRKLLRDYQAACPSQGAGRKRPSYSKARAIEVLSRETVADEGVRWQKMDWFEYERHYRAKMLSSSEIESKWKAGWSRRVPTTC